MLDHVLRAIKPQIGRGTLGQQCCAQCGIATAQVKDVGAVDISQQFQDDGLLNSPQRLPGSAAASRRDGGPSRELPKDYYRAALKNSV
jgi:hypothetical protein